MSWKSLLSAGMAVCLLSSVALADPSIVAIPRAYQAAQGGIRWEILVTTNDLGYTGALSIELPLTLTSHTSTPAFVSFLNDAGGDDTNGALNRTWYYNETASGSGTLVWNITDPADAADHTQNNGDNPFTMAVTDGLEINTAAKTVFASLGSTVGLADALTDATNFPGKQVRVLHVLTSDGILSWNDAIIGENGVQYSGISGSASSIIAGDMNANGNRNQGAAGSSAYTNTGAFQDPTTLADVAQFLNAAGTAAQSAACSAALPGLNCEKRGDVQAVPNGTTTLADVAGFLAAINNPAGGAVVGGGDVPEPTSMILLVIGGAMGSIWRRRR